MIARRRARGRGANAKLKAAAQAGAVGGPLREGRRADRAARSWASRSRTGWCRSPIRTRGRSGRGSSASRTNSGTSARSARYGEHQARRAWADRAGGDRDREPGRGHAPARHRRRARADRDLPARGSARWRLNVGPTREALQDLAPETVTSLAVTAWLQTYPATDAAYRTGAEGRISHLKRGYGRDPAASKATKASRSGPDGRSSPTTLTRSPSEAGETLAEALDQSPLTTKRPRPRPARPVRFPRSPVTSFPRQVAKTAPCVVGCVAGAAAAAAAWLERAHVLPALLELAGEIGRTAVGLDPCLGCRARRRRASW